LKKKPAWQELLPANTPPHQIERKLRQVRRKNLNDFFNLTPDFKAINFGFRRELHTVVESDVVPFDSKLGWEYDKDREYKPFLEVRQQEKEEEKKKFTKTFRKYKGNNVTYFIEHFWWFALNMFNV